MASTATKRAGATEPGQYGSADIQVLEGVAHVRLRPGMYIGTTSSTGSAPPRLRGGRQLDRRGDGRALRPDHRPPPQAAAGSRSTTTAAASRSSRSQGQGPASGRGGRPHDPERRRASSAGDGLPDLRRAPRRGRLRRERPVGEAGRPGACATAARGRRRYARGKATTKLTKGKPSTQDRHDRSRSGPTPRSSSRASSSTSGVAGGAPAGARVPHQGRRDPADRRAGGQAREAGLQGVGRPRRLREAPRHRQGDDPHQRSSRWRRARPTRRPTSRCSGPTATPSRSTRSRTRSTPTRAACTRRA